MADPTLPLPRLLCLHGGGTNARIFHTQCRALRLHLAPHFRLVFADAPHPCARPGPDVLSVYADWGPFRSWFRMPPDGSFPTLLDQLDEEGVREIDESVERAVRDDDRKGATGKVVGVLGFSQGAKLAGSLLWRQQVAVERAAKGMPLAPPPSYNPGNPGNPGGGGGSIDPPDYRFAVLLAGRPPLVSLHAHMQVPGVLHLPTLHVHGLRDPGLALHRNLYHLCCEDGSARVLEWEGDHRIAIRTEDVKRLVGEIVELARRTGLLGEGEGEGGR